MRSRNDENRADGLRARSGQRFLSSVAGCTRKSSRCPVGQARARPRARLAQRRGRVSAGAVQAAARQTAGPCAGCGARRATIGGGGARQLLSVGASSLLVARRARAAAPTDAAGGASLHRWRRSARWPALAMSPRKGVQRRARARVTVARRWRDVRRARKASTTRCFTFGNKSSIGACLCARRWRVVTAYSHRGLQFVYCAFVLYVLRVPPEVRATPRAAVCDARRAHTRWRTAPVGSRRRPLSRARLSGPRDRLRSARRVTAGVGARAQ